jgi:hypothetical protein
VHQFVTMSLAKKITNTAVRFDLTLLLTWMDKSQDTEVLIVGPDQSPIPLRVRLIISSASVIEMRFPLKVT